MGKNLSIGLRIVGRRWGKLAQRTLGLVCITLVTVLILFNCQVYAWEESSGEVIVREIEQSLEDSLKVKLEIISPEDGSEIFVKENSRYEEPLEFKVRITNLGNDILNLNSDLIVSLDLFPIDGGGGVQIWYVDDLKLEPNEFSEESYSLVHHLISYDDGKPVLGEYNLHLTLQEYVGLDPQGTPSWVRKERTSILLNLRGVEFTPRLFIEIDYMPGHKPTQSVLDYIKAYYWVIDGISVTFYVDDEVSFDSETTTDEFFNYEATFNDLGDDKITPYWFFWKDYKLTSNWKWVLFGEVDATHGYNGYTYTGGRDDAGNYIFVADKSNDDLASKWEEYDVTAEEVETVVLMHELGHAIGIMKKDLWGNEVYDNNNRDSVMSVLSIVNCNAEPIHYSAEYWELKNIEYYLSE